MPDTPSLNDLNKTLTEEIYKQNLELLRQRRRTEQLLYSVSEAVIAIDPDLRLTIFNNAAEKMFQIKATDVIGKKIEEVVAIETEKGDPIAPNLYCFQEDPEKSLFRAVILMTPYRRYYINLRSSIITYSRNQRECLLTMTDITKEIELDKTKDDFISVTSHELRTPITIIKSYLWMLTNGKAGEVNEKQRFYVDKAISGAERLLNLINDTLNISRIENGKVEFNIEEVNIKLFVHEMAQDFKVKTDEKKLQLILDIDPNVRSAYADKDKLREVMTNFFGNSFKFTSTGNITIKVENTDRELVKIAITDTGKGIAHEDLKRLFHKFGRLDNSYQTVAETAGTGLGLYIVKTIVEAMGGNVGAFSEGKDKGSTFWFTLPTRNINKNLVSSINYQETVETISVVDSKQNTESVNTINPQK